MLELIEILKINIQALYANRFIFFLQLWLVLTKGMKMFSAFLGAELCSLPRKNELKFTVEEEIKQ